MIVVGFGFGFFFFFFFARHLLKSIIGLSIM